MIMKTFSPWYCCFVTPSPSLLLFNAFSSFESSLSLSLSIYEIFGNTLEYAHTDTQLTTLLISIICRHVSETDKKHVGKFTRVLLFFTAIQSELSKNHTLALNILFLYCYEFLSVLFISHFSHY